LTSPLLDSPGVPPSANAHELFRGFSFVDPTLLDEQDLPPQVAPIFERVQEVLKHSYIKQNKLTDEYEVEEQIGTGSFSICRRCVHKVSRAEYAVKVLAIS
jgi:ribosomal protein S6 kinase alpha-1/2/3/6